ncbi:MAG: 2'-5' RNA ligase family protein [Ginsengibacter sp.]
MKQIPSLHLSGYQYNEYKIVLEPNKNLSDKILLLKKEFSEKYGSKVEFQVKPQITIVKFLQFEMMEIRLINHLKNIASTYAPFNIELKGYGNYPSHTIYLNIESKQQIQNLTKGLKSARQLMKVDKNNEAHFINDPNIFIAQKLLPWQYEKGWMGYGHRYFTGRFIAENMLLMKKSFSQKYYRSMQRFEFLDQPVDSSQGQLFL